MCVICAADLLLYECASVHRARTAVAPACLLDWRAAVRAVLDVLSSRPGSESPLRLLIELRREVPGTSAVARAATIRMPSLISFLLGEYFHRARQMTAKQCDLVGIRLVRRLQRQEVMLDLAFTEWRGARRAAACSHGTGERAVADAILLFECRSQVEADELVEA